MAAARVRRPARRALVLLAALLCAAPVPAAEDLGRARRELEAVAAAIRDVESWLSRAGERRSARERAARAADFALAEAAAAADRARRETDAAESGLAALRRRRGELEEEMARHGALLADTVRLAYMTGGESLARTLFGLGGGGDGARMLHYARALSRHRAERVDGFRHALGELERTDREREAALAALRGRRDDLDRRRAALERAREERDRALAALNRDIAERAGELDRLRGDQAALQALVERIARAMEAVPPPAGSPSFAGRRGRLAPPVPGRVVGRFGSSRGAGGIVRRGVSLAAEEGSAVRAVHAGRVAFADWLRGAGLLVILDHGDGYMSLYGANRSLEKSAGDRAEAGEVIARSGRSMSDGLAGVYFEIRKDGRALDPMDWLRN